jgi:hypothetical protein
MWLLLAGSALLLSLLAGIFLDSGGAKRPHERRRDVPPFDAWL